MAPGTSNAAGRGLTSQVRRPRAAPVLAIVRRDLLVGRAYRIALVADLLFGLLNLALYYFISEALGSPEDAALGGAPSYFAFAAIGVVIVTVIGSASIGLARRVREEQLTGTLETLVAQPVSVLELALGLAGYPFLLAVARAGFYIVAAEVLIGLGLSDPDWAGFVIVLLASTGVLVAIGVAMTALVLILKRAETLLALISFALGFLGGAYFPRSELPPTLEAIGAVLPTRFAFDGARDALLRGEGWEGDALVLLAMGVVGLPAAIALFVAALGIGRRRGTLAQY
jgi:ABC-2 type transport system permease protein